MAMAAKIGASTSLNTAAMPPHTPAATNAAVRLWERFTFSPALSSQALSAAGRQTRISNWPRSQLRASAK